MLVQMGSGRNKNISHFESYIRRGEVEQEVMGRLWRGGVKSVLVLMKT